MIDYSKYSNMDKKQLLNSLLNAEKKEKKLELQMQEKLNDTRALIAFLKSKIKESLDETRYYTIDETPAFKKALRWAKQNPQEAQDVERELEKEMQEYYSASNNSK